MKTETANTLLSFSLGIAAAIGGGVAALPMKLVVWCVVAIALLWAFAMYRFQIDKIDIESSPESERSAIRDKHQLLRRARSFVRYVLPAGIATLLALGAVWKAAPNFVSSKAEAVVSERGGRETLRYRAGPVDEIIKAPHTRLTVVILAPREQELRQPHTVAGVDLNDVVEESLAGMDSALAELALFLVVTALIIIASVIVGDMIGMRQYVRAASP